MNKPQYCPKCNTVMTESIGNYELCITSNPIRTITLINIPRYICQSCEEEIVRITKILHLKRAAYKNLGATQFQYVENDWHAQ